MYFRKKVSGGRTYLQIVERLPNAQRWRVAPPNSRPTRCTEAETSNCNCSVWIVTPD
jgi:hypothetical protein